MEAESSESEVVYGTHDDTAMVMSEKVQSLAGSIYQEFERMIQRYDEDVVKTLMPLLVNVLECLDSAYQTNQEQDVELELLREDNEQLVTQYEREKNARKQSEQKLLETEDLAEQENKELASRLESLESIVRMLELKHKNSMDHASRLEEREAELKKEYSKLHERYTELFKTHVDYMERAKMMMGNSNHSQISGTSDRLDLHRSRLLPTARSSGPVSYGFTSLENSTMVDSDAVCSGGSSSGSGPSSLHNELDQIVTAEKSSETEKSLQVNQATSPQTETQKQAMSSSISGKTTTKKEQRSGNTLYQELSFQDDTVESEDAEITGGWVHPGDYASSVNDNFFGMGKEVENLILENNELLATKNALNIVKDDLIVKVDELTGEIEILREELNAVILSRNKLKGKVSELEEELKKTKAQVKQSTVDQEEEGDIPMAQRKRFTRVEMARVLMERNQYKERFMELQDAVRWTEMMRASRVENLDKKSKQSIWKFFSNLFSSSDRPPPDSSGRSLRYNSNFTTNMPGVSDGRLFATPSHVSSLKSSNVLALTKEIDTINSDRVTQRRRDQYRQVRAHVQKEDGRLQAYGWSLPSTKPLVSNNLSKVNSGVPVPVPVYCRPLAEASPHMKVWCASGVNLYGGYTRDGGCMVGASIFYSKKSETKITEITDTDNYSKDMELLEKQLVSFSSMNNEAELSSYVWICTSTHSASTITVIDAKNPAEVLDSFPVCQNHLLCICTVQGAVEKDYALLENSEVTKAGEMLENPGSSPDDIGKVTFIKAGANSPSKPDETTVEAKIPTQSPINNNENSIQEVFGHEVTASEFDAATTDNNHNIEENTPHTLEAQENDEPCTSSVGPTMWMGAQNGMLYIHSSITRWNVCLHKVKLPDSILSIVHVESRVVVALANGSLAVFRRQLSGEWDTNNYHILTLGSPKHSIRCLTIVGDKVWAAHRNKIHVIDPITLTVLHSLEAHPRKESQIRQMTATGLGVWISIRLDSTLRLFSSETYCHIQDIDIEPYVSKMLGTGKLGFSFVRITALLVSCNRLWIGTGNGVVISVPLSDTGGSKMLPRCCMANAQLSFHGHRDAVKFFVAVPMNPENQGQYTCKKDTLVLSGGEGYIDFRLEESVEDACDIATHILVWRVNASNDELSV